MNMGSMYRVSDSLIEGHEAYDMLQRFPKAGDHQSLNYLFASTHPDAVNPFVVGDLVDAEGEKLTGDALVLEVGKELVREPRDRAIHLTKSEASSMAKSPIWRLWTKEYDDDRAAFEADYLAVKAMFPALPEFTENTTYQQAADWLRAGIELI